MNYLMLVMQYGPLLAQVVQIVHDMETKHGPGTGPAKLAEATQLVNAALSGVPALAHLVHNPDLVQQLINQVVAVLNTLGQMGVSALA